MSAVSPPPTVSLLFTVFIGVCINRDSELGQPSVTGNSMCLEFYMVSVSKSFPSVPLDVVCSLDFLFANSVWFQLSPLDKVR